MKKRDLIYLLLAAGILLAAGYLAFTQLAPKRSAASGGAVVVERVGSVPAGLDAAGMSLLRDSTKVRDFESPEDLTGLGNKTLFGP